MEIKEDNLVEEDLLEILEDAIEDEKASQARYQKALEKAKSSESRALFQDLMERELEHQRLLEERHEQIKKRLEVKIIGKWSRWMRNGSE